MFKVCQILVAVFAAGGIVFYFRRKRQCQPCIVLMLVGLLAVSCLISNVVLQCIPMPTDQVVVTATGEKNLLASKNEVSIKGYLVGGKEYELKPPVEGKWFWRGDIYKWREESDPRQPKGTTRSITLEIPYGKDRSIQFYASEWNGIVEVTDHGNSRLYDLFPAKNETIVNAAVADTNSRALYLTKFVRLLIFATIVVMLMAYPCYVANKFDSKCIREFFYLHWGQFTYATLAICCFAVMVSNSDKTSFWLDEVWTVGWIYLGYPGPKNVYLLLNDLWYSLMPYGQKYLLILPEFFAAASVYIAGKAGELYKGKRFGVIMAALFASSFPLMGQGGGEFRSYAMLFFCASELLYFYIKKQKERCQKKSTLILYVAFLILAMDTHPFGMVLAGLLMGFDFVLIAIRKVKPIGLIEFIAPGLYALYWLSSLDANVVEGYGSWASQPSLSGVFTNFKYLCNNSNFLLSLFLIGVVITITHLVGRSAWDNSKFWESYGLLTLLMTQALLIGLMFLYSLIFRGASLFINRYFTVLLPNVIFFIATAIYEIIRILTEGVEAEKRRWQVGVLSCVLILCIFSWSSTLPGDYAHGGQDYRGAAEYLMSQNDIYSPSSICLVSQNKYFDAGLDYYLTQKGKRDPIYHVSTSVGKPDNLYEYKTIYYVYYHYEKPDATPFLKNGYVEEYNNKNMALIKYVKATT